MRIIPKMKNQPQNVLFIQNFGPVKQAELELKSINMLIGEQSIGKSTIAKLIAIFTDNASLSIIASTGFKAWKSCLAMYDLDVYADESYRVKYKCTTKDFTLSVDIAKGRVSSYILKNGEKITDRERIREMIIRMRDIVKTEDFLKVILKEAKQLSEMKEKDPRYLALSLQSMIESSLYVPAERVIYSLFNNLRSALSLMRETVSSTYMRFMVNLDRASARQKKYESQLLKITYLNEDDGQFFLDHASKKKYSLIHASSGIQSTIPLLLVLDDIKNREYSSVVIEEPETNLFPNTQVDLLKLILRKAKDDGRIVTVTTHSPYLLSALNNYLFAGSMAGELDKEGLEKLDKIIPSWLRLHTEDCSVYSIGESINESGAYCTTLIDEETKMIETNTLDKVSFLMGDEFDAIQDIYMSNHVD